MSWFRMPKKQRDSKDLSLASWLGGNSRKQKQRSSKGVGVKIQKKCLRIEIKQAQKMRRDNFQINPKDVDTQRRLWRCNKPRIGVPKEGKQYHRAGHIVQEGPEIKAT